MRRYVSARQKHIQLGFSRLIVNKDLDLDLHILHIVMHFVRKCIPNKMLLPPLRDNTLRFSVENTVLINESDYHGSGQLQILSYHFSL